MIDPDNPVIRLCILGTQAEFQRRPEQARDLYHKAWHAARDDYERCIAAHYVARFQTAPQSRLHWNLLALRYAQAVADVRVGDFYPSLYLNVGQSYELLGDIDAARRYYDLAADIMVGYG